jgi:hypothetical protein
MLAIPNARTAQEMIDAARRRFPRLSADGIMLARHGAIVQPIVPEQVEAALEFLSRLEATRTPRVSSYQLKHCCEDFGPRDGFSKYCSNGALITAALSLGLVVRSAGAWIERDPNCLIGVSLKSLRRIMVAGAIERKRIAPVASLAFQ